MKRTLLTAARGPAAPGSPRYRLRLATGFSAVVLLGGALHSQAAMTATLLTTFSEPVPAHANGFGFPVAALGTDKVLIGAMRADVSGVDTGAAYLFDLNGALLRTFPNPTSQAQEDFSFWLAAVGTDKVLIGARNGYTGAIGSGTARLFHVNGTLLTTFTNPAAVHGGKFGWSLAGVGVNQVLIGAPENNMGGTGAGAAYLYDLNNIIGTPQATFTSPTLGTLDGFGFSVAAVGTDKVVIGATLQIGIEGRAYLFDLNGTVLTTFHNPAPAGIDSFGFAVAAVGTDKVVIGSPYENAGAGYSGAAYLFSLNGTLLTTLIKPTPQGGAYFGQAVAGVGTDKVLIGAPQARIGGVIGGEAYLFDLNGTLLATIADPTPRNDEYFGRPVAAVGTDKVLIGAGAADSSVPGAGAAYLYSLDVIPVVAILLSRANAILTFWTKGRATYIVEAADELLPPERQTWRTLREIAGTGGTVEVHDPCSAPQRYYRVREVR